MRQRGGGLFLHDNIGFAAVVQLPTRLKCVGFWISNRRAFFINIFDYMYIKFFGFISEIFHTFPPTILFHVFLVSSLHAACPAYHILSDMITLNIPDEEETYKL